MNAKFIKLLSQATELADEEYGYDGSDYADIVQEKFAELIVKECTDFLKDTLDDHFAAEQLEEHFGVEE